MRMGNLSPLVTVVTVTYNSSLYVRTAIESVLASDYPNLEYIIGDDCSTDNTWEIIQEYKDERIVAYRNDVNLREYPNRNKAISMAKGHYLMFIDGDDYLYPYGISFLVKQFEAFPNAEYLIQKEYTNNVIFPVEINGSELLYNFFAGGQNLLNSSFSTNFFKTSLFKRKMLPENFKAGDEVFRILLCALNINFVFTQGWVSWPRETPGQASSKLTLEVRFKELLMLKEELKSHLDQKQFLSIENEINKILFNYLKTCIVAINVKLFWKVLASIDIKKYITYQSQFFNSLNKYSPEIPLRK